MYAAIARLFPDPDNRPPTLLAVPGYARIDNAPVNVNKLLPEDETRYQDDEDQARRERLWAAEHPKRFLASTVAVGTIDQALLTALQTPHAHLCSVCLDRSLLVVDEVHASDPYMRRLLPGLLRHHLGLGGHALLLSATLGSRARAAFTQTAEPGYVDAIAEPYPALTDAGGVPQVLPGDSAHPKKVCVELKPCLEKPESLLPEIAAALKAGARVLVVLNTVGRAIALQRAAEADAEIEPVMFRCAGIVAPHHGRFAPVDRELLDQAVTDALGKHSEPYPFGRDGNAFSRAESLPETGCSDGPMERRHLVGIDGGDTGAPADKDSWEGQGEAPLRALLLIGTQTLEQSLDIDADLLITDHCPMDVLLQSIGRLHRHAERSRPPGFRQARCILLVPETGDLESLLDAKGEAGAMARKAGLGSVYPDMRVLQLTRDLLAEQPNIEISRDNRRLVEGATHGEKLATLASERWDRHGREMEGGDLAKGIRAHYAGLTEIYQLSFGDVECQFRENEEARTRLGLDSLRIPLERTVKSPLGQPLAEIIIPGHLADKKATAKHEDFVIAFRPPAHELRRGDDGPARADRALSGALIAGRIVRQRAGLPHGDAEKLEALQARIEYAARWDIEPEPLLDFHTVDLGQDHLCEPGWTTHGEPEHRGGGPDAKFGTHIRYRHYWANGLMTLAVSLRYSQRLDRPRLSLNQEPFLEGAPASPPAMPTGCRRSNGPPERPGLDELAQALREPARPLFLGRKACLPAAPLLLGCVEADNVLEALRHAPLATRPGFGRPWRNISSSPEDAGEIRSLFPSPSGRRWPEGTHEGVRVQACWPSNLGETPQSRSMPIYDRRDWRNQIHAGRRLRVEGWLELAP